MDWEDNERLEYLGDAVLDFLLAEYLFTRSRMPRKVSHTAALARRWSREALARLGSSWISSPNLLARARQAKTGDTERPATVLRV